MDPYRINVPKQLISFRLSNETRDELQECVELRRALDALNGSFGVPIRRDRTESLESAITHYCEYLKHWLKGREEAIEAAKKKGRKELADAAQAVAKSKR